MRNALALLLAAGLAAPTALPAAPRLTSEQRLAQITRGAAPGKPTTCINLPTTQDSETLDGLGILYRMGRTFYLNRFEGGCNLTRYDTLVTSIPSTQLCRGDIARVYESATRIPKGSCVYGEFTPYERGK